MKDWLIMKRGLYFRPDAKGYTGIRDEARARAQRQPMRNDIAQMISDGWKSGKSSIDVAEEILREFDAVGEPWPEYRRES